MPEFHTRLIIRAKSFFLYDLPVIARVHPLRTDRRTTTMPIARPLLKYGRLKTAGDCRCRLHQGVYAASQSRSWRYKLRTCIVERIRI